MTDTRFGIVLLNYNGSTDTLSCLDSLLDATRQFDRLVICDNGSSDGSLQRIRDGLRARSGRLAHDIARLAGPGRPARAWAETTRRAPGPPPDVWVLLLDNLDNRGFAAGNNSGLAWLVDDPWLTHFWLLNNDTIVPTESPGALVAAIQARPDVDLWGGTVLYHDRPDCVQALCGGALDWRSVQTRHLRAFTARSVIPRDTAGVAAVEAEADYVLGACMVASRRWVQMVGMLSETYFLYYEELDWATRGKRAGLKLGFAPEVVVLHKEGASIGTAPGGGSPLSVHHLVRSRVLYAREHLGPSAWWGLWCGVLVQALKFALRRQLVLAVAVLKGFRSGLLAQTGRKT